MALLEIIHLTGDVERRDLYKRQPMTIGSHSSCDLRIDEEGVEIMHCRISWNKDSWEAVAAGTSPFELNGTPVERATLKSGDTLRFGTVDVRFHGGATVDDTPKDIIGIKPTSDEAILATRNPQKQKAIEPEKPKTARSDEQLMQSLEMLALDSKKSGGKPKKSAADDDAFEVVEDDDEIEEVDDDEPAPKSVGKAKSKAGSKRDDSVFEEVDDDELADDSGPAKPGVLDHLKKVMKTTPVRPGEQDPLKSPLVLGLLAGSTLLVLLGFTFYFIAFRRIAETEFAQAKALVDEGKYKQGMDALEEFVRIFPKHEKKTDAIMLIGLARIDQQIGGGASNYAEGVKSIREFVNQNGGEKTFEAMKPELATRAGNAALGAATMAGKNTKVGRALLVTASEAKVLFSSYSPKDAQPTERIRLIDQTMRNSSEMIRKSETSSGIMAEIEKANTDKKPMEALRLRRELLAQYPDYANDKNIRTLLSAALEVERTLVEVESPNTPATTDEEEITLPVPRTLMFHARSRSDQVSVNEVVWVLSKDCLYGIDTVTGLPVWRRLVGDDPAFFPVDDENKTSLLYFDSDTDELVRVKRSDGGLLWRQSVGERAAGQPVIEEAQIYLTTVGGSLLKIDLQSGSITSRLTFSQPVTGPAIITAKATADQSDPEKLLVVVGDQDVVYTLTMRPLECVAVSYFAQKSLSVSAPMISMGTYVAFVENLSEESSVLHLLKRDGSKPGLVEAASGQITGMVVDDAAVIRGRDLFIPSTVERVSAFSVSDSPDEPALTKGPTFQVQGAKGSPIFLTTGPEGQVWMSSSELRRLQLISGTIQADPKVVATGISSQPNQSKGALLYNARRRPFTDAVTLTQTERETLDSEWQVMAGAKLIAVSPFEGEQPTLLAVTEGGATFRVAAADLTQPGFHTEYAALLPINKETTAPLMACALPDAQIAVICGEPESRIWVINRLGQIERQGTLPAPPQAAPVALGKRIVVPLAGGLHVARTGQADSIIQDFQFPSGDEPPVWKQVLAANDKTLIGLTEAGELLQLRLESNPRPHLAEVARQPLPSPAIGQLVMNQGRFAVACSTGDVFLFDGAKFEPAGRRTLDTPASGAAYSTEAGVLVETGRDQLHCLNADAELTTKWTVKLPDSSLAGQPVVIDGALVLVYQSGLVQRVNPESGELLSEQQAAGSLDSGPMKLGTQSYVLTWDGSLIPLTAPAAK